MEKTFDTLQKVLKYIELDIEGNGNEMACYSYQSHTKKIIRSAFKKGFDRLHLLVMDNWSTWAFDGLELDKKIKFWREAGHTCRYSFQITKVDDIFKVRLCLIPKDL